MQNVISVLTFGSIQYLCTNEIMMNLAQDIQELLVDHDCVIVPGLGGFVCNYQSARIEGNVNCTLFPPSKFIIFNTKLTHNDGLLASYLSRKLSIDYEIAKQKLKDETEMIIQALKQDGHYLFPGVGQIVKTINNGLEFNQTDNFQFLSESFGLMPIVYSKLELKKQESPNISFTKGVHKRRSLPKMVKQSVVLVPMFLLAALLPSMYLKNSYESAIIQLKKTAPVKMENPVPVKSATSEIKIKNIAPKAHYFIVTGSFKNIEKAQSFSKQLRSEGYQSQVIEKGDYFIVSISSFENLNEANSFLIKLQDSENRFVDAWLLID